MRGSSYSYGRTGAARALRGCCTLVDRPRPRGNRIVGSRLVDGARAAHAVQQQRADGFEGFERGGRGGAPRLECALGANAFEISREVGMVPCGAAIGAPPAWCVVCAP